MSRWTKLSLRIVEATESDVPETMDLQFATCDGGPFCLAIRGPNTRDSRKSVNQRVLTKWCNDPFLRVIKCIEDIPVAGDAATTTTALSKSTILSLGYLRQNAPQNGWPRTAADAQLAGGSGEGSGQGLPRAGSREETKSNARSAILLANKPVHISQFPAERSCYGASAVGPLKEPMSSAFRLTLRRRMLAMGCMPSWDSRR